MRIIEILTEFTFFGVNLYQYILAAFVILLSLLARRVILYFYRRFIKRIGRDELWGIDVKNVESLSGPLGLFIIVGGFYLAFNIIHLPAEPINLARFLNSILMMIGSFAIGWIGFIFVDIVAKRLEIYTDRTETKLDDQLVPIVKKTLKVTVGILVGVAIIQNLGYSVTSLVAGLGLGGLAFALAAKDTVSNIFGSITIFLDRPFQIDDWVEFDGTEGTIEEVGFRSTRIRTFAKTLITVPNSVVANATINNYTKMPIRRVSTVIGVTYETTPAQMEQALEAIRNVLRTHPSVKQDFFLVYFTNFGTSSLNIMLYYFSATTVWEEYLKVRQDVNLGIMRELEKLGVCMAFPSQTIYLKNADQILPERPNG